MPIECISIKKTACKHVGMRYAPATVQAAKILLGSIVDNRRLLYK